MAFHLGSLGFLTPFEFDNFEEQVNNVLEGKISRYLVIVSSKGSRHFKWYLMF